MTLSSAQSRLQQATKKLAIHWQETRTVWDDRVARDFEARTMVPLEGKVRAALSAMTSMGELLAKARSECQ